MFEPRHEVALGVDREERQAEVPVLPAKRLPVPRVFARILARGLRILGIHEDSGQGAGNPLEFTGIPATGRGEALQRQFVVRRRAPCHLRAVRRSRSSHGWFSWVGGISPTHPVLTAGLMAQPGVYG